MISGILKILPLSICHDLMITLDLTGLANHRKFQALARRMPGGLCLEEANFLRGSG